MPFDEPLILPPVARIEYSAATELSWLVIGCGYRNAVHTMADELETEVDLFWDDGEKMMTEILVLAQQLGCLFGWDIEPLLSIADQEIDPEAEFDLSSESENDRVVVRSRLRRLAADRQLRLAYQELLRAVWADAEPLLHEGGRAASERAVQRMCASIEHGQSPIELIPENHIARRDTYIVQTQTALHDGTMVITPCYLAGHHGHIVALPGVLSVALGTGISTDMARQRLTAERVARDLKLLSDPTRLLILTELGREPATVGQIADRVGVAQPTASVHVRQLREAGLLEATRDGASSSYRVERARVRDVLQSAHDALLPVAELAPAGR
jgi:DNA-binding transcriptional ArsR family regulator